MISEFYNACVLNLQGISFRISILLRDSCFVSKFLCTVPISGSIHDHLCQAATLNPLFLRTTLFHHFYISTSIIAVNYIPYPYRPHFVAEKLVVYRRLPNKQV